MKKIRKTRVVPMKNSVLDFEISDKIKFIAKAIMYPIKTQRKDSKETNLFVIQNEFNNEKTEIIINP